MSSREQALQATIDRLALELAKERAAHQAAREELAAARRSARTWLRVAKWIHAAQGDNT